MTRRRTCWLVLALAVLIAGAAVAWTAFGNRDPDFQHVGPTTRGTIATFKTLDSTIDTAEFHDCKTLKEAVDRVNERFKNRASANPLDPDLVHLNELFTPKNLRYDCPVQYSAEPNPVSVKAFLRMTFRQASDENLAFFVGRSGVAVTTLSQIEKERARYAQNTSLLNRLNNGWKELIGDIEEDPPLFSF